MDPENLNSPLNREVSLLKKVNLSTARVMVGSFKGANLINPMVFFEQNSFLMATTVNKESVKNFEKSHLAIDLKLVLRLTLK